MTSVTTYNQWESKIHGKGKFRGRSHGSASKHQHSLHILLCSFFIANQCKDNLDCKPFAGYYLWQKQICACMRTPVSRVILHYYGLILMCVWLWNVVCRQGRRFFLLRNCVMCVPCHQSNFVVCTQQQLDGTPDCHAVWEKQRSDDFENCAVWTRHYPICNIQTGL